MDLVSGEGRWASFAKTTACLHLANDPIVSTSIHHPACKRTAPAIQSGRRRARRRCREGPKRTRLSGASHRVGSPRGVSPSWPVGTAVTTKTRLSQTTGEPDPRPGIFAFHLTFSFGDQFVGGLASGAVPFPVDPRQCLH